MADRVPPFLLATSGMVFFQSGGALAVRMFPQVHPAGAALIRVSLAAVILCTLSPPPWRELNVRQIRTVIPFGLALGAMNLCFYEAIERIPFGTAVTIQFIGPLAVALIGRRHKLDLLWVALAALGVVALASPEAGTHAPLGYLFAAIGAVGWGIYIPSGKRIGAVFSGGSGLAVGMTVACAVPLIPALATVGSMTFSPTLVPIGVAVALLSSVIPYTLEVEALRRLPASVFGTLMSLEPVLALAIGAVLLEQVPSPRQFLGVAAVAAAAAGVMRKPPEADFAGSVRRTGAARCPASRRPERG